MVYQKRRYLHEFEKTCADMLARQCGSISTDFGDLSVVYVQFCVDVSLTYYDESSMGARLLDRSGLSQESKKHNVSFLSEPNNG